MDKLQTIFMQEANELISDLERALLDFERDLHNPNAVQEIFRVMHTLKGSASMFGFERLSQLTHDLETIYDAIRDGRTSVSKEILEVTLQSVDHLKAMMADPDLASKENAERHAVMLERVKHVYAQSMTNNAVAQVTPTEVTTTSRATYYIFCKPVTSILKNGTNPLYLIDDLAQLGDTVVLPHLADVPALDQIVPDHCYSNFEVVLASTASASDLKDVFLFVEDACELIIEKISDSDLLVVPAFRASISNVNTIGHAPFGLEIVRTLAQTSTTTQSSPLNPSAIVRHEQGSSIRVASEKLDELMNLVSELVTSQARLTLIASQHNIPELVNVSENMDKITRRLRDTTFNICLVPIETLVTRFQRLVRDLAKDLKKEIEFVAEGTETELDRSIIEKVTDPILHMLRNCIDHGIESPDERTSIGKTRQGTITLKAFHSGTSVYIQIKDNGRGIDPEKIRQKAIAKGLITADDTMSDQEVIQLVFAPGFSTAEKVTDVSGRGVGMDIVKRNIESIHGEVSLETVKGEGTTITVKLPLTLSIMDGMLVKIAAAEYILPLSSVDKCYEMETRKLKSSLSQKVVLDGDLIPVFNLREAFHERTSSSPITQIIKLHYNDFPVGITVDAIIGEYQAVMKPLGGMYQGQDEFSGATILGDGSVALVVDTDKMVRQLIKSTSLNETNA